MSLNVESKFQMINFSVKFDESKQNSILRKTTLDFKLFEDFKFDNCQEVPQGLQIENLPRLQTNLLTKPKVLNIIN